MGSRHFVSKFTDFCFFADRKHRKFRVEKKYSTIWRQILLGSLSFFIIEPAWAEKALQPESDSLKGYYQSALTPPSSLASASLAGTFSEHELRAKENPVCQKDATFQACTKQQSISALETTAPVALKESVGFKQSARLDQPAPSISISTKAELTGVVDSHRADDLGSPQDGKEYQLSQTQLLQDHPPRSWTIASTPVAPLEAIASQPVSNDSLENETPENETPSSPSFLAQETPPAAAPGLEDCPLDPELGCLRIPLPAPLAAEPSPVLLLVPRLDFFHSNNILSGVDPVDDGLLRPSLTLLAIPSLGPNTVLVTSIEGSFNRYFRISEFNYDELRIRAGIFQRLSPNMTGEIGWINQQLFISGNKIPGFTSGTRFLNDHAIRLEVSRRDQLAERLSLSSVYQFRVGFAQPDDRSRIINLLFLSLNHELTSKIQLGLDYQFAAANFTVVPRTDIYHQILGRVTLMAFPNTQVSVYGGFGLGHSTLPNIDFNSYIVGVSMSMNLVLF